VNMGSGGGASAFEKALAMAMAGAGESGGIDGGVTWVASSPQEANAVEELRDLQRNRDKLDDEFEKERIQLEKKYLALYKPIDEQRGSILKRGDISHFWLRTLMNCRTVADNITPADEEALKYLVDIKVREDALEGEFPSALAAVGSSALPTRTPGEGSFTLIFEFGENPFFTNTELTKSYVMNAEEEDVLEKATGCEINWKSGKKLTTRVVKRTQKGHGKGKGGRTIVKTEPCDSFFNFFSPPELNSAELAVMEELNEVLEADFEVGDMIRSEIVPNAVLWFTGEAHEDDPEEEEAGYVNEYDDDYDDEDDDEDDEDDFAVNYPTRVRQAVTIEELGDDDDEDEDDNDDDGEYEAYKKSQRKAKSGSGNQGLLLPDSQPPEECKQQ